MTMPYERTRAVLHTREFLHELLDAATTPGVPESVREAGSASAVASLPVLRGAVDSICAWAAKRCIRQIAPAVAERDFQC